MHIALSMHSYRSSGRHPLERSVRIFPCSLLCTALTPLSIEDELSCRSANSRGDEIHTGDQSVTRAICGLS